MERDQAKRRENYASHTPRYSDSSLYDEVCTTCGARDFTCGNDELGDRPCTRVRPPQSETQT